jgi:IS30 family transposase
LSVEDAAAAAGVSVSLARRWFRQAGGVKGSGARPVSGRFLSFEERVLIDDGLREDLSIREIAAKLGRHPSTVSREIERNKDYRGKYRPVMAQQNAQERARRPKASKLAVEGGVPRLRCYVQDGLRVGWSPEQISARLALDFPERAEMRVSHETIYQSIYVQGRGGLGRELAVCLRTGRAIRRPRRRADARTKRVTDKVLISDRPAEVADRAVPGHWEGDLIVGKDSGSAIGTLVERTSRFTMLLHLPGRHDAITVRDRVIDAVTDLPTQLRRSLTWDQGAEMARHKDISAATDMDVYFCDPHSPWQRGTNENTNGLLRQYFPKGTDLSTHSAEHLARVAALLNARPRKTLGWRTPAEHLHMLLFQPDKENPVSVATTG